MRPQGARRFCDAGYFTDFNGGCECNGEAGWALDLLWQVCVCDKIGGESSEHACSNSDTEAPADPNCMLIPSCDCRIHLGRAAAGHLHMQCSSWMDRGPERHPAGPGLPVQPRKKCVPANVIMPLTWLPTEPQSTSGRQPNAVTPGRMRLASCQLLVSLAGSALFQATCISSSVLAAPLL